MLLSGDAVNSAGVQFWLIWTDGNIIDYISTSCRQSRHNFPPGCLVTWQHWRSSLFAFLLGIVGAEFVN